MSKDTANPQLYYTKSANSRRFDIVCLVARSPVKGVDSGRKGCESKTWTFDSLVQVHSISNFIYFTLPQFQQLHNVCCTFTSEINEYYYYYYYLKNTVRFKRNV